MYNPFEAIMEKLNSLELQIAALKGNATQKPAIEIIDRNELCKRLDITPPTARLWEKKGKLPYFMVGSNIRYNWNKVIDALEKRKK